MTSRRPTRWIFSFCALLVAGSTAWALPPGWREQIEHDMGPPTPPGPGRERAQLRGIPWCGGVRERDKDWAGLVNDDLNQYRQNRHSQFRLFHLARAVCSDPEEPLAQRIATEVLQLWINETGMTASDAVESLALRADKDGFKAERIALCDALKPKGDDIRKERTALATARYKLFGCWHDDPLWLQADVVEHLGPFIDRGSAARDDLAHLAWVLHRQFKDLEEGVEDALIGYAIDQFDFHAVSADAVLHQLDAAPYRGSRYARVMVLESLGHAQVITAKIEALVAKKVSDPEWKEMLITAPDRGAAAWNAAAERDKAALARSDEFDRKLHEGGDIHGCQAALRPDFMAMWKTFKHEDLLALETAMSDHPLAGLLAKRFARCLIVDGDSNTQFVGAELLQEVLFHIRAIPGPRTAAYYAVLDAKAAQRERSRDDEDGERRPRRLRQDDDPRSRRTSGHRWPPRPLGFTDSSSGVITRLTETFQYEDDRERQRANDGDFVEGQIKSVGKIHGRVHVVFVKKKKNSRDQFCRETNKIDAQDPRTGKITYRKDCHWGPLHPVDVGPDPVDVPAGVAAGLQPGRFARFSGIPSDGGLRLSSTAPKMPLEIYRQVEKGKDEYESDSGKHLLALFTFPLE